MSLPQQYWHGEKHTVNMIAAKITTVRAQNLTEKKLYISHYDHISGFATNLKHCDSITSWAGFTAFIKKLFLFT